VNAGERLGGAWFLPRDQLQALLDGLRADGRTLVGPTVRDGAIVLDEIDDAAALPKGVGDRQAPGRYRLVERDDDFVFSHVAGPASWKRWTYPSRVATGHARRDGTHVVEFRSAVPKAPKVAFLGVRACDLAALATHDRVFLGGPFVETDYQARRAAAFVVAVQCTTSASTCFCTSMGTGPEVKQGAGHDVALTEVAAGFVLEAATPAGAELLERLPVTAATMEQAVSAVQAVAANRARLGRTVETAGLRDRLLAKLDHPRWNEVASRCIGCASCTLACPTCFCSSVERHTSLDGSESTSERVWDSCFNPGFAKVAGGDFRAQGRHRYRQWLVHKFATWWDQFGRSGCTGCGRCITFCPVGIDVREELAAIAPAQPVPEPPAFERVADDRQAYVPATITEVVQETHDTWTLRLAGLDAAHVDGGPGQFVMVALPGHPAAAISVSRYLPPDGLVLTIRAAGAATRAITSLPVRAQVGIRGPVGRGWPVEPALGRDVVIVTGGTGLAPLRPLIDRILAQRGQFGSVRLYYGARTAQDMLYADELEAWDASGRIEVICRWLARHRVGGTAGAARSTVSAIHQASWEGADAVAYVCGPERMMEATAIALAGRGVERDRVYVTLERHMECGLGFCGHCQLGRHFVCRDGPVFRLSELGDLFGREGA
jgi:NAD(P)H-flavin reductase/formate hydrogenlyase subunit 6/NADH:ubiquinone oxidoreductase subunit I